MDVCCFQGCFFQQNGRFPGQKQDEVILDKVMDNIRAAEIWIPEYEVEKHYIGTKSKLYKRWNQSLRQFLPCLQKQNWTLRKHRSQQ